jgi:two-component sensor histidine kinase
MGSSHTSSPPDMITQPSARMAEVIQALSASPLTVFGQDRDLRYVWIENAQFDWFGAHTIGLLDADVMGADAAQKNGVAKLRAMESGQAQSVEFSIGSADEARWYEASIRPHWDGDGNVDGVIGWIMDITEKTRKEAVLKALLREVSHRSKNLLAMVLSIAMQTGRSSKTTAGFIERFAGRLQSMAKSQDLITDSNWRGATIEDLAERQVLTVGEDYLDRVTYIGDAVNLAPNAALHVGLAFHELVTNALAHGALSEESGEVRITAAVDGIGNERHVAIEWRETGGPSIEAMPERRFGSITLERVAPAAVGGNGALSFDRDGLLYRLNFDLTG